jgi:hypothetical protein
VALGILLVTAALAGSVPSHGADAPEKRDKAGTVVDRSAKFFVVDPKDLKGLREWTEVRCRGWTLKQLASSLGVDTRKEVVLDRLARGLPAKSRMVVIQTCEEELEKTERRP